MVGKSAGYHSLVLPQRRNMTHRINEVALSRPGNTFGVRQFSDQSLEALKVFHGDGGHEIVAARASSCPSAPDSVRIQPLRRPLQRSFALDVQPCRTSFRRVATADRAGGFIHREFACDITKCVSSSIPTR